MRLVYILNAWLPNAFLLADQLCFLQLAVSDKS